jgi:Protein of unknown function (DUF3185)
MQKVIGVVCLVAGVALLFWGHDVAESLNSQVKQIFTGTPTEHATYFYIGGTILCAVGVAQLFWPPKK